MIAEISANHTGSIKKAKELILTAKKNGADGEASTYEPRNMTINSSQKIFDKRWFVERIQIMGFI